VLVPSARVTMLHRRSFFVCAQQWSFLFATVRKNDDGHFWWHIFRTLMATCTVHQFSFLNLSKH